MEIQDSYQIKGFRLNKKTIESLGKLKKDKGLSYNLLFTYLLNMEKQSTNKTGKIIWQNIKENEPCPYCKAGKIIKKSGKFGEFWACSEHPYCGFTQSINKLN